MSKPGAMAQPQGEKDATARRDVVPCYTASMDTLTLSLRHVDSQRDQPCSACGSAFVPAEDSGSRVLSIKAPTREAYGGLLCGGCYSKWSHGATITIRANAAG